MKHQLLGRLHRPSTYLLGLAFVILSLSGCSWLPITQDESSPADAPAANQPAETVDIRLEKKAVIDPVGIEPPEPEVEFSNFGIPKPEIVYQATEQQNSSQLKTLCEEIGGKLGSVSLEGCLSHQFSSDGGLSVLGRPLAIRDFPELEERESLGRVLLIGGIHGDEFSAVSIAFKWMEILDQHHSGIFHWRFIPVSNPDGLLAEKSTRQNKNGVDLNRNFPSQDWDELALAYWQEKTESNSRRYPGPSAGSEPEAAWLVQQIKDFQPDVIISVHAPYHLVDYDGPPEAPQKLGDLHLKKLGVFPGSLGNYAGVDLGVPVVTIELPYAGILPNADEISMMWTDLVAWLVEEQSKVTVTTTNEN